ncbi:MAG: hypothetical protein ABJM29_17700 [Rhizobiaceae bacterium]
MCAEIEALDSALVGLCERVFHHQVLDEAERRAKLQFLLDLLAPPKDRSEFDHKICVQIEHLCDSAVVTDDN